MEGFLTSDQHHHDSAVAAGGVAWLELRPAETLTGGAGEFLDGSGGDEQEAQRRAHQAVARLQGMLGPDAVQVPVLGGGRSAAERARWVPWGVAADTAAAGRPVAGDIAVSLPHHGV